MINKNSKIVIYFKQDATLYPVLNCIMLEDSIAWIRVLNNIELLIPWSSIDYIQEVVDEVKK